jgi:Kef-type K+ transport system membrane component KefB
MFETYFIATIWFALAILATILAAQFKISMALMEICIGALARYLFTYFWGYDLLKPDAEWIKFVASSGAILLTFLAGAELDPESLKSKTKESLVIGLIGFLAPFAGCALLAKFVLGWSLQASLLAGIALSTTSMAVVYAVMLEYGFNKTEFGKGILSSCFINDLGTVIALGLIFAPFDYKTIVFIFVLVISVFILPSITSYLTRTFGNKTAAIRTKWILFLLFGLGSLALWSRSEAVLPAI